MINQIEEENKNKSGIYVITNIKNGKIYIGSGVNLSTRFRAHRRDLQKGKHWNIHLQRSYDKYGPESFVFSTVEICEEGENILEREQFYLDISSPDYNIAVSSAAPMTGRKHSKETKELFCEINKGEKNGMYGKKHSKESLELMSENRKKSVMSPETRNNWIRKIKDTHPKYWLGKKHTEETKRKISEKKKKCRIKCDNGKEYISQIEAAKDLNVRQGHISECVNGKRTTAGGYKFWKV